MWMSHNDGYVGELAEGTLSLLTVIEKAREKWRTLDMPYATWEVIRNDLDSTLGGKTDE